jgi:ATP-dependent Clp protease protease subunit
MTKIQEELLKRKFIEITGEVNGRMAEYVQEAMLALVAQGSPEITLIISSGGGDVDYGLAIYDLVSLYSNKVTGIVMTHAQSMAALILQACSTRKAALHSRILIHHISRRSLSLDTLRDKKKLAEVRSVMEKSQRRLDRILATRTGKSVKIIRRVCKRDENMTAEEAKEFGLIDVIETGRIAIEGLTPTETPAPPTPPESLIHVQRPVKGLPATAHRRRK